MRLHTLNSSARKMENNSVKSFVSPKYTRDVIRQSLSNTSGHNDAWIVVEAQEDVDVYSKFKSVGILILTSFSEYIDTQTGAHNEKCSRRFVMDIVREMHAFRKDCPVIGICDRDYSSWSGEETPRHIFLTDHRDLEMSMLADQDLRSVLEVKIPDRGLSLFANAISSAREIGYMRIVNDVLDLGVKFQNASWKKPSRIWNQASKAFVPEWRNTTLNAFCGGSGKHFTTLRYSIVKNAMSLESCDDYDICQGHDTMNIWHYMVSSPKKNLIWNLMFQHYNKSMFSRTNLCKSIEQWGACKGKIVWA